MTEYEQVMRKIRAVQTHGQGEMGFHLDDKPASLPANDSPANVTPDSKPAPLRPLAKRRTLVAK